MWLAVFVVDHVVSHVPSPVQSQRTWIAFGGSWSSLAVAVNVKTVLVSPELGVHVKSTDGGAFGGGGGEVTWTTWDALAVSPPESTACTKTVLFPAELKVWVAVFVVDHDVSHVPSPVQSHRTWIVFGGSWSSLAVAVNVKTVLVSPEVGVQVKSTVGGPFGGGGGEVTETMWDALAVRPPESFACTTTV